jgi:hypothetical protein
VILILSCVGAAKPLKWHAISQDDEVLRLVNPSDGDELFPCVVEFPPDKPLQTAKQEEQIISRRPIRIHGAGGGDFLKLEAMEDDLGLSLPYYYGSCDVRSLLRAFEEECMAYCIDDANMFDDYAASVVIEIEEPWEATITLHNDDARTEIAAASTRTRNKCLRMIQACIHRV